MYTLLSAILLSLLQIPAAEARIPILDPAIGHALDVILAVAGRSTLASSMQPISNAEDEARVRRAVTWVRSFSGIEFRYGETRTVLVKGNPGEPNAFCTGPSFYVSKDLVEHLNDRQLVAVIAHEMAHAEQGHLTERMTHSFAAILLQAGRLVASDVHAIVNAGDADAFMRELWRKGQWQMIQEMLDAGSLGQEMEADCYAYQWLSHMRGIGLANRPQDIADAQVSLIGVAESSLASDTFMGPRIRNIRLGAYDNGCN